MTKENGTDSLNDHNTNDRDKEITRLREEHDRLRRIIEDRSVLEKMYRTLFESGHDAVFLLESFIIKNCNTRSGDLFGYSREEFLGSTFFSLTREDPEKDRTGEKLEKLFQEAKEVGSRFFEWTFLRKNGARFQAEVNLGSFTTDTAHYNLITLRDISFRKHMEHELRTKSAQLLSTLESIPFDFWMNDTHNRTILQNYYSRKLWGDTFAKHMEEVVSDEKIKEKWRDSNNRALKGEVAEQEITYHLEDGEHIYRNIVAPILDREQIIGILGLNIDITEYKRALKEREILLKEVHHRVKNNLQIIVSMINLQRASLSEKEVDALIEIENRINSMAIVHDQLYNSENFEIIQMRDYFYSLFDTLLAAFEFTHWGPSITINSEDISLPLDTAIPLGMIANELLTNCLKHAFIGREWGTISLSFSLLPPEESPRGAISRREGAHAKGGSPGGNRPEKILPEEIRRFRLEVSDDGAGLPKDTENLENSVGLGFTLVRQLSEQIDGRISYKSENGLTVTLDFTCTKDIQHHE